MHAEPSGWDDEVPADDDHVMAGDGASSSGDAQENETSEGSDDGAAGVPVSESAGVGTGTVVAGVHAGPGPGSGSQSSGVFIGSTVDGRGGVCTGGQFAENGGDFQLMYVRGFLRESGEDTIPERLLDEKYKQLDSYIHGRLDEKVVCFCAFPVSLLSSFCLYNLVRVLPQF